MSVVVPALLILILFLAGFPVWMHSPHSIGGRLFAYLFGAVFVAVAVIYVIGQIAFDIFGWKIFRD
jgi:hypothetical protein